MAEQNDTTDLARREQSAAIGTPLVGQGTSMSIRDAVSVCTEPLRATVTRRRKRVNFRQRYESRGVDRYRDIVQATTQVNAPTLDVMK